MKERNKDRPGYKKTKVGWIPEEWEFVHFGAIVKKSQYGLSIPTSDDGEVPIIGMAQLQDGRIVYHNTSFINITYEEFEKFRIRKNDLIFNRTNSLDLVGKSAIAVKDLNLVFASYLVRFSLSDSLVFPDFVGHFFYFSESITKLKSLATPGVSQYNINPTVLQKKFFIPLPPLPEQKKIAEILSAWDRAIEKVGKLIETKQRFKKGLMQQLLTGRIRFPEFGGSKIKKGGQPEVGLKVNENRPGYKKTKIGWIPEEWGCSKLGELINCYSGGTPSRANKDYFNGNIPWIKSGELNSKDIVNTEEYISEEAIKKTSVKLVEPNSLLLALYGATAGIPAFTRIPATINQAILAIIPKKNLDNNFLFFWLNLSRMRILKKFTQGGQPNLSAQLVRGFFIPFPPFPEQKKIATILSACDREIDLLCKKEAALKKQKKGLMQKLLTGEVRVITNQE